MNEFYILVAGISLACEYIDASLGGGYGTILSPTLILLGIIPTQAVPAVLIGQLCGGVVGGISHQIFGNIKLDFRNAKDVERRLSLLGYLPRSEDAKVLLVLAGCGIFGAVTGAFGGMNLPSMVVKTYIGVMVLAVGILILFKRKSQVSWKGLFGLGLVSAFNKGISGGGYGPLVTGGQLIIGRAERSSVGSTTASEVAVCIVGFLTYLIFGEAINWNLALAAISGAVIGAPLAAYTVKKTAPVNLKRAIAFLTITLGALMLVKVLRG